MVNFHQFAKAQGLLIRDLRDDGRIHRCPTVTKPKSNNGAYMLDHGRGWVMDWQQADKVQWWQDENAKPWTDAEKAALMARQRGRRANVRSERHWRPAMRLK